MERLHDFLLWDMEEVFPILLIVMRFLRKFPCAEGIRRYHSVVVAVDSLISCRDSLVVVDDVILIEIGSYLVTLPEITVLEFV